MRPKCEAAGSHCHVAAIILQLATIIIFSENDLSQHAFCAVSKAKAKNPPGCLLLVGSSFASGWGPHGNMRKPPKPLYFLLEPIGKMFFLSREYIRIISFIFHHNYLYMVNISHISVNLAIQNIGNIE
jgi:hypothetical protein